MLERCYVVAKVIWVRLMSLTQVNMVMYDVVNTGEWLSREKHKSVLNVWSDWIDLCLSQERDCGLIVPR